MAADPQPSDADLPQNFVDWYIDPLARTVGADPAFGVFPLHLKCEDDFNWRLHFKVGGVASTNPIMQLSQLTEIKFVMLEKGRYNGTPLAQGVAAVAWNPTVGGYEMPISLNGDALKNYLATLDATSTGFTTGGFDCTTAEAKAAGTTTTTTTAGTTTTETVAPGTTTSTPLTDYEFMGEFRWVQSGKQMRSQTFAIFVSRDLITSTAQAVVIAPPALPTDWRFLCTLTSEGTPFNGDAFGYVKAPVQMEVLGLQVALQQVDPAQGFRIQLTDAAGNLLGGGSQYFGDLPANTAFATLNFGAVLAMNAGDELRAVILNYAGDMAAGLTVNLVCRQYLTNSPSGPSGGPGITAVTATTLPSGTPPTASIVGQLLKLGLPLGEKGEPGDPGAGIANVQAITLAPNAPATALLVGTLLKLGIPAGATGSYMHVSAVVAQPVQFDGNNTAVTSVTFRGVGKPALVLLVYRNRDDVKGNMTDAFWNITRSDEAGTVLSGQITLPHVGNTYPVVDMTVDPQTSTNEVTYTLNVGGYSGGLPSNNPATSARAVGHAGGPLLVILEITN